MRRIAALVLPRLPCELAGAKDAPLAVVWITSQDREVEELTSKAVLGPVNEAARRYGVRPGQTAGEARALVAHLILKPMDHRAPRRALAAIAEMALAFGPCASIDLEREGESHDTVWLDLTSAAHLSG